MAVSVGVCKGAPSADGARASAQRTVTVPIPRRLLASFWAFNEAAPVLLRPAGLGSKRSRGTSDSTGRSDADADANARAPASCFVVTSGGHKDKAVRADGCPTPCLELTRGVTIELTPDGRHLLLTRTRLGAHASVAYVLRLPADAAARSLLPQGDADPSYAGAVTRWGAGGCHRRRVGACLSVGVGPSATKRRRSPLPNAAPCLSPQAAPPPEGAATADVLVTWTAVPLEENEGALLANGDGLLLRREPSGTLEWYMLTLPQDAGAVGAHPLDVWAAWPTPHLATLRQVSGPPHGLGLAALVHAAQALEQ